MVVFMGCLAEDGVSCAFQIHVRVDNSDETMLSFTKGDGSNYQAQKCILCVEVEVKVSECKVTKGNSATKVADASKNISTGSQTKWFYIYPAVNDCGDSKDGQVNLALQSIEQTFTENAKKLNAKWITDSHSGTGSGFHWTGSGYSRTSGSSLLWNNPDQKMKIVIQGIGESDGERTKPPLSCGDAYSDHRKIQISVDTASRVLRDRIMV
jgi:hypothetical protein